MTRWILLAMGLASCGVIHAHHFLDSVYDSSRQVTIEGVVRQFHFVNPHPFVTVDVKPAKGNAQEWRLEMDNRSELAEIGMSSDTLKPGDRVVVTGSPARVESQRGLYIRKLDRPADGFRYEQIGSTPRIQVQPR